MFASQPKVPMINCRSTRLSQVHPHGSQLVRRLSARTSTVAAAALAGALLASAGCARRAPTPPVGATGYIGQGLDVQRLYQGMGLVASIGAMPFVGSFSFLRAPSPDSTLVLVALSLPARSLSFTREGDRYSAVYNARIEVRQNGSVVRTIDARETVRVPTFRETSRTDESVIWQHFLRLAPGTYQLQVGVRDETGIRNSTEEVALQVPRLGEGSISSPIAVYEALARTTVDSLPRILTRPRSSAMFGQDSVIPVYVEATGAADQLNAVLTGDNNVVLWRTIVTLAGSGDLRNATISVPLSRMGIGITTLRLAAPGSPDTSRARILVSLGEDLPIASFEEMVSYLRWFTTAEKLRTLRDAAPEAKAEAWANLLQTTDPYPSTPENEAIRDYFLRIRTANQRFRDDAPVGWQSDRGTAYVGLGDPDDIFDANANDPTVRIRQQVWVYREYRLQLVFIDQSGFGRWKLNPSSLADLQNVIRRKLAAQQQ